VRPKWNLTAPQLVFLGTLKLHLYLYKMRTVIFYATKYGTTASVANEIAKLITLDEEVEVLDIKNFNWDFIPDFKAVSRFVIGVPMYAGKPLKSMRKFCDTFFFKLEKRLVYLFVCGSEISPEKQQAELEAAFPENLRKIAKGTAFLGGAFHWEKMNFVERFIIKRITGRTGDMDMIRHKAIKKFAEQISTGVYENYKPPKMRQKKFELNPKPPRNIR